MYDIIKKQNSERFAQTIRKSCDAIFDIPNIDKIVKYAGTDAKPILSYLHSLQNTKFDEQEEYIDPITLLDKAGYNAYVANTLKKQNEIKKYFAPGEKLCTFDDPNRFKIYHIINAVHKDVANIKRSDFKTPQREDKYGTSVISIQILKTGGFISIKNRYNATVENPDNTFYSNPDNIISGLGASLRNFFGTDFTPSWRELPNGYRLIGNQICKFNEEIDNVYIGENFYIKNDKITEINPDYEFMLGRGMILNIKNRTVKNIVSESDDNLPALENTIKSGKINTIKHKNGSRSFYVNKKHILDVFDNEIVWVNVSNAPALTLKNFYNLGGCFNFSNIKNINLCNLNLYHVSQMKFNQVESLYMSAPQKMYGNFDFSGVNNLKIFIVNFSNTNELKFNKNAESIHLNMVYGIYNKLDFSNVKRLNMHNVDLSNVPEIKLNPNGNIYLDKVTLNSGKNILTQYRNNIKIR
jgi:hypothetical protein